MKLTKKHSGFTLVEILVTVLILSIGLLGLAGLQVRSMKGNHNAYLRTQATILAYDIIDRMRANPNAVKDGNGNVLPGGQYEAKGAYTVTTSSSPYTVSTPSATASCKTTAGCTVAEMASNDINEWRVNLATVLPGGVGVVCQDGDATRNDGSDSATHGCNSPNGIYAVKIWWNDVRDGSGNLTRFVTSYIP